MNALIIILLFVIIAELTIIYLTIKNKIMTKEELKAALSGIADKLNKAKDEIIAAMNASGNVDADTEAAVNKIGDIATALDELNPDAPPPTPEP